MTLPPSVLHEVLPRFDAREVHDVFVPVSPEAAFAAAKAVTIREVRVLMPLMALRTLPRLLSRRPRFAPDVSLPVLDAFVGVGFVPLGERPGEEVAIGAIGRFWRLAGNEPVPLGSREEFAAFAEPGYAKAALSFAVRPEGGGARVVGGHPPPRAASGLAARRAPTPLHLQSTPPRGACRKPRVVPHNRRPQPGTDGNGGAR